MGKRILVAVVAVALSVVAVLILYRAITGLAASRAATGEGQSGAVAEAPKPMTAEEADKAIASAQELLAKSPDSPRAEAALASLGAAYSRKGDFVKAREAYRKLMEKFPSSPRIQASQQAIDDLNVRILFSPDITPDFFLYTIEKGDNLTRVAKRNATTVEYLMKANSLKDNVVRIGQKLKVPKLKFSIIVDKSQNILTLKANGEIFKTYRVATGKNNNTPVGTFKITNKIVNPPWYPPSGKMIPAGDPKNVLGSRWLGISKPSYGIHGTIDPGSIGRSVTEGCVRMKNEDVEELYSIVPEGTEVVITD